MFFKLQGSWSAWSQLSLFSLVWCINSMKALSPSSIFFSFSVCLGEGGLATGFQSATACSNGSAQQQRRRTEFKERCFENFGL